MKLQSRGLLSPWAPLFLQRKRRRKVFYSPVIFVSPSNTLDHKPHSQFLLLPTVKPSSFSSSSCLHPKMQELGSRELTALCPQHKGGTFPCSPGRVSEAAEGWQLLSLINSLPKPRDCSKAIPHLGCDVGQKYCSLDRTQPLNCPVLHRPGQRVGNNLGKRLYSKMSNGRTMWKMFFLYKFLWKWVLVIDPLPTATNGNKVQRSLQFHVLLYIAPLTQTDVEVTLKWR